MVDNWLLTLQLARFFISTGAAHTVMFYVFLNQRTFAPRTDLENLCLLSPMASPTQTRKRHRADEEEFTDMASLSPTKVAKVHGYVQALSPMKQSSAGTSKYFTCEVTDGQSHRRAVGFDSKVHQKLAGFYERKMPVAIGNCQIKQNPYSSSLDSDLHQSPLEFPVDVNTLSTDSTVTINLEELPQLSNFQNVSVTIKVTDVRCHIYINNSCMGRQCWHFKRRLFIQVIWLNSPHVW